MCLGVPGIVTRWIDRDPTFGKAEVAFDGIRRVCHMACVPDAQVGDYVVVHAGIAISRVDTQAAQRLLAELQQLGMTEELDEFREAPHSLFGGESP